MNINVLIFFIGSLLGSIFLFFKPISIKQNSKKEIPQLELYDFTMYEFDRTKLTDIAAGKKAFRFKDRDLLFDFVFNDNAGQTLLSLSASRGKYKNDTIDLKGDVLYTKSDGIEFRSEHIFYDRKKAFAKSDVPYTASMGKNFVKGTTLYYDLKKDLIKSNNIYAIYNIPIRK